MINNESGVGNKWTKCHFQYSSIFLMFLSTVCVMFGVYNSTIKDRIGMTKHERHLPFFRKLNEGGVYSFDNVCIESDDGNITASDATTKIVVYSTKNGSVPGVKVISVAGSANTRRNHWTIHFVNGPIPTSHRLLNDTTAYFVVPTCPGNFNHFWADEFIALWSVVKRTGRLVPGADNHIIYNRQFHQLSEHEKRCFSVTRYESFLHSLYIVPRHEVYWMTPTNTCFTHGVFGVRFSGGTERDVIEHVTRYVLQGQVRNLTASQRYITIIDRRMRKILNTDELLTAARRANFSNVRAVDFDSLSVALQVHVATESSVLIGIVGAGLQWAMFMASGRSAVVEIAWPALHWGVWYGFLSGYGLKHVQLTVEPANVHLNWTSYEFAVLKGRRTNATERQQIIKAGPRNAADNVWKWADVVVDVAQFIKLLTDTSMSLR